MPLHPFLWSLIGNDRTTSLGLVAVNVPIRHAIVSSPSSTEVPLIAENPPLTRAEFVGIMIFAFLGCLIGHYLRICVVKLWVPRDKLPSTPLPTHPPDIPVFRIAKTPLEPNVIPLVPAPPASVLLPPAAPANSSGRAALGNEVPFQVGPPIHAAAPPEIPSRQPATAELTLPKPSRPPSSSATQAAAGPLPGRAMAQPGARATVPDQRQQGPGPGPGPVNDVSKQLADQAAIKEYAQLFGPESLYRLADALERESVQRAFERKQQGFLPPSTTIRPDSPEV